MVEEKIEKIYVDFVKYWNDYLMVNPRITLDDSWPSLGVIDLLTFSTRFRAQVPEALEPLLTGSSAYIAKMLCACWHSSVDQLRVFEDETGICVEAEGGDLIPEDDVIYVPIEKLFRQALQLLPNPFPVTRVFSTDIKFESNVVSLFCIGIFTGLAPGIEGEWSRMTEAQLEPLITEVKKHLADSTAKYYANNFSNEPLGQVAELYLNDLIYPPMMMREELPLLSSISKLLDYFEECQITKKSALALGYNLTLIPDHLLSNVGLVLSCALNDKIPPPEIVAVAQQKGSYVGFLRRAMKLVRAHFGHQKDWVIDGIVTETDERCFIVERVMRFTPWLSIQLSRLKEDAGFNLLSPLLIAISDFNVEAAADVCDRILEEFPDDIDVHVQKTRLVILQGEFKKADGMFRELLDKPEADTHPEFYNLWGNCMLSMEGKQEEALRYFKAGLKVANPDPIIEKDLANNAAWASMLVQEFVPASLLLEQALTQSICPITPLLNKCALMWDLGQDQEARRIRQFLFEICPTDRRVFASLTLAKSDAPKIMQ